MRNANKFPLLEGKEWSPDKVNFSALILDEAIRTEFYITHRITKCQDPNKPENQIFCYKFIHAFDFLHKIMISYPNKTRSDFWNMLKGVEETLKVGEIEMKESIDHIMEFFEAKVSFNNPRREIESITLKIKDINRILFRNSTKTLDWYAMINNNNFLKHLEAKNDDELVFIEDKKVCCRF